MAAPVKKYVNPVMAYRAKWNPHLHKARDMQDPCGLMDEPQLVLSETIQAFKFVPATPQKFGDAPLPLNSQSTYKAFNARGESIPMMQGIPAGEVKEVERVVKKPRTLMDVADEVGEGDFQSASDSADYSLPVPKLERVTHPRSNVKAHPSNFLATLKKSNRDAELLINQQKERQKWIEKQRQRFHEE